VTSATDPTCSERNARPGARRTEPPARPSRPIRQADLEAQYRQVLAWHAQGQSVSFIAATLGLPWERAYQRLRAAQRWQAQRAPVLSAQSPLIALRISETVQAALRRAGLQTLGEVYACPEADLLAIQGVTWAVLRALRADLAARYRESPTEL
jgi:hypothetical protein